MGDAKALKRTLRGIAALITVVAWLGCVQMQLKLREPGEQAGGKSQALWEFIREGMEPEDIGPIVLAGIRDNVAYLYTHDFSDAFADRFQRVLKDFERLR